VGHKLRNLMIFNVINQSIILCIDYYFKLNGTLYCIVLKLPLSLCYQIKTKNKVMKKLIFAAYTIALVALAPAVFVGYLNSNNTKPVAQKEVKAEKADKVADETSYPTVTLFVAVK
jgi:hypothetical protein